VRPAAEDAGDADRLDDHARLLPCLTASGVRRRLARIDRACGKRPVALDVLDEEDPPVAVPDETGHRRREEQIVADLLAQPPHVLGHPH
jgi:hypothetical protein